MLVWGSVTRKPMRQPVVIGAEGNYFGEVLRRHTFRSVLAAETHYTQASEIPPHRHQFVGFFLVLRGTFQTRTSAEITVSSSGDIGLHVPQELHSVRVLSDRGRGFSIEAPALAASLIGNAGRSKVEAGRLPILLNQIYQEFHHTDTASDLAVGGLILQIKAELMRLPQKRESQEPAWLKQVEELLCADSDKRLSMDDLASACGLDPRYLANYFRLLKGCTPAEYQRRRRLRIAQRKLVETTIPITQIAAEAGFYDQSHFCNSFKRMYGCTPLGYRQVLRSNRSTKFTRTCIKSKRSMSCNV